MKPTLEQGADNQAGPEFSSAATAEKREADVFSQSIERLPAAVKEVLGEEEKNLLRQIYEKDPLTFEHSLAVAGIVDKEWLEFSKELEQESLKYEDMIRAAALHDVGKLALPDCILKSTLQRDQLADLFMNFVYEKPDQATAIMRSKGLLSDKRTVHDVSEEKLRLLDHRDVVPLNFYFRDNPAAMAEIISSGLDQDMSFLDALKTHERKSKEFVLRTRLPDRETVAALAGTHHNYDAKAEVRYPSGSEVLKLSVKASELLRLADTIEAMTADKRAYQKSLSESEALDRIAEMTRQGLFNKDIAERWMRAYRQSMASKR